MVILFYAFLFTSWLHDMPVFLGPTFGVDSCRANWWINFLYLNNFIDEENMVCAHNCSNSSSLEVLSSHSLIIAFAVLSNLVVFGNGLPNIHILATLHTTVRILGSQCRSCCISPCSANFYWYPIAIQELRPGEAVFRKSLHNFLSKHSLD